MKKKQRQASDEKKKIFRLAFPVKFSKHVRAPERRED